jgi:hypothetical protein
VFNAVTRSVREEMPVVEIHDITSMVPQKHGYDDLVVDIRGYDDYEGVEVFYL